MIAVRRSRFFKRNLNIGATVLCGALLSLSLPLFSTSADAAVTSTAIVTGLYHPYQVAFDAAGDMFIAGGDSANILEVTAAQLSGTAPYAPTAVTAASGIRISGITFDANGDLWYCDQSDGQVYEITVGQLQGPAPYLATSKFTVPDRTANSIAFDGAGNLYIADDEANIYEVSAAQLQSGSPVVTTAATFTSYAPYGLTFDAAGNLYFSDGISGVEVIPAAQLGGATVTSATPLLATSSIVSSWGLAFAASGNLYIADQGGNVWELTAAQVLSGNATPTLVEGGFANPIDVTFGTNGSLYLADFSSNQIDQISGLGETGPLVLSAPRAVTPPVITGLSVSETSGSISASWSATPNASTYTCTLLYAFNDPSLFTDTTTSTTCSFAVNSSSVWGISVTANDASGRSAPVSAFGTAVVPAPVRTSLVCVKGKHAKRVYGTPAKCPKGWHKK